MLKANTVFILGAGTSAELNMPLGAALKSHILEVLPGVRGGGVDAVRSALYDRGDRQANSRACATIRGGLEVAASIDNFVEHHAADRSLVHCAKVGIVAAILRGERQSGLYVKDSLDPLPSAAHGSTFGSIFRLVVGNCRADALGEAFSRVAFVNFNYDRCLEQYLYSTLVHHSGLAPAAAAAVVDGLDIWHPYGTIGPLNWSSKFEPGESRVEFGSDPERLWLERQATSIRTFSEERGTTEDQEIKAALRDAAQIVFLGCAFHRQNLRLIEPADTQFEAAYGTCYVPAPQDPAGLAVDPMVNFSAPTASAFSAALRSWRTTAPPTTAITFAPLTSLQLVTKYGAEWEAT